MAARKKRSRVWLERAVIAVLVLCIGAELVYWFRHRAVPGADVSTPEWVEQDILPLNPYSRPGTPLETIDGVVVHYVGNPGTTAQQNHDFYDQPTTTVSSHFLIGLDGEIIQCIPLDEKSSASNDRNIDTLSIEVCHPDETGKFNQASYDSLVKLTAWLCDYTGIGRNQVIRHYDITGKLCPLYFVEHEDAWNQFLQDVADY